MNKKESFWIPYADLMTVLMVIFLFISLSYMGLVQYQKKQQDKIFEEYKQTKENLYKQLRETFKDDFKRWDLEIDKDLSIKFTNPNVLFQSGKSDITPIFQEILKDNTDHLILIQKASDGLTYLNNIPLLKYQKYILN